MAGHPYKSTSGVPEVLIDCTGLSCFSQGVTGQGIVVVGGAPAVILGIVVAMAAAACAA